MKFLTVLFSFLFGLTSLFTYKENDETLQAIQKTTEFEETLKKGYDLYKVIKQDQNDDYFYEVAVGKYKNDLYYDIFFYNITTEYGIRVLIDDVEYGIESQKDGDHYYYAIHGIPNPQTSEITVYIYTGLQKINGVTIPKNYDSLETKTGNGNGITLTILEPVTEANKTLVYTLAISIGIISICLIVIGIFFVIKVGKKGAKKIGFEKNIPNIDFYNGLKENLENIQNKETPTDENTVDVTDDATIVDVYDKSPKYDSDDIKESEENKEVDIESLLLMKGLGTDYSIMDENEKNEVMVYLMVLRETKQITYEQYSKEVIKLWRN